MLIVVALNMGKRLSEKEKQRANYGLSLFVLSSTVFGLKYVPMCLFFTPLVICLIATLVVLISDELPLIERTFVLVVLLLLYDIGVCSFSGGNHDCQGLAWVTLVFLISLVFAFVVLVIGVFLSQERLLYKMGVLVGFVLLFWVWILFFHSQWY